MKQIDVLLDASTDRLIDRVRGQLPPQFDPRFIAVEHGDHNLPVLDRVPVPVPPDDLYRTARTIAEGWAEGLDRFHRGLFTDLVPSVDLRPAYLVAVTLRLGQVVLPRLISYVLSDHSRVPLALVDFGLDRRQVRKVQRLLKRLPRAGKLMNLSAVSTVGARKEAELLETAALESPPKNLPPEGGVLALIGNQRERLALGSVTDAWDAPVSVLPKTAAAEATFAAQAFGKYRRATALPPADDRRWIGRDTPPVAAVLRGLQDELTKKDAPDPLLHTRLAPLFRMVRQAVALGAALARTRPRLIVGSLDRTPTGALLRPLAKAAGSDPSIVDIQHGTLLPFHIADLMDFDLALTWNEASRDLLSSESRGSIGEIAVVGNPHWDALRSGEATVPDELRDWAARHSVIAYFPQAPKGAYLTTSMVSEAMRGVTETIESLPGAALLVKRRDSGEEDFLDLGRLARQDRARVLGDDQTTLHTVLHVARAAISIYSTALSDAVAAGVPALSFDPTGTSQGLGLDFSNKIEFCRNTDELATALKRILTSEASSRRVIAPCLPFPTPYPHRVFKALRAAGISVRDEDDLDSHLHP